MQILRRKDSRCMGMNKLLITLAITSILLISLAYFELPKYGMFIKTVKRVREPVVAGKFYPADKEKLENMVDYFLNNCKFEFYGKLRGIIVPHAGYAFSGQVAACGFKQISKEVKLVIILGPSHYVSFRGFYVPNYTHFKTPLGEVKISEKAKLLRRERLSKNIDEKFEHSIEVEIPFLQKILGKDFEIIPIITGIIDAKELSEILAKYIDNQTLIVVSSDLSHYHSYEMARKLDKNCISSILNLSIEEIERCEACGKIPILTISYLAKKFGWEPELIMYRNSGDVTGNKERVVGYASIGFYEGLKNEEEKILLKIARETLESYIRNRSIPSINESSLSENLKENKGCFVTLYKNGNLRGCIGSILPIEPLYRCVIRNTINAAVNDMRFLPVREEELKDIKIEISVLSIPKKLEFKDWRELLNKLEGREGVIIKIHHKQATYLPQVWKIFENKEEFLSNLCLKAGANIDCWKKKAEIYVYEAEVFEES